MSSKTFDQVEDGRLLIANKSQSPPHLKENLKFIAIIAGFQVSFQKKKKTRRQ
jgi:hypothetical protein